MRDEIVPDRLGFWISVDKNNGHRSYSPFVAMLGAEVQIKRSSNLSIRPQHEKPHEAPSLSELNLRRRSSPLTLFRWCHSRRSDSPEVRFQGKSNEPSRHPASVPSHRNRFSGGHYRRY